MSAPNTKILIIDDDQQVNLLVGEFLRREGFAILSSTDGEKGLRLAAEYAPDLILCDLDMPTLDGWGVVSRLREHEQLCELPVIFLSGCRDRSKIRQSINLGGDDFLSKPVDLMELLQAIKARLSRARLNKDRAAGKVRKALEVFAGIVHDGNDEQAGLRWLADTVTTARAHSATRAETLKPTDAEKLTGTNSFLAKVNNRQQFVKLTEVKAFLAYGEYSEAYWGNNQKMLFRKPLKQWIKELPAEHFVRIHRQSIVNFKFFQCLENDSHGKPILHLRDFPKALPVSQRCAPKLRRFLKEFQPG